MEVASLGDRRIRVRRRGRLGRFFCLHIVLRSAARLHVCADQIRVCFRRNCWVHLAWRGNGNRRRGCAIARIHSDRVQAVRYIVCLQNHRSSAQLREDVERQAEKEEQERIRKEQKESYKYAAVRELKEELGIKIPIKDLGRFDVITLEGKVIHHLFTGKLNKKVQIHRNEIASYYFLSSKTIKRDIALHPRRYAKPFHEAFKFYLKQS